MQRTNLLIALAVALLPLQAIAASCGCSVVSPSQKYDSAQVVFTGDAIRYVKSEKGAAWTVLRFTPVEAWKGAGGASIDIEVPTQDGSCSVEILIGHRYLIYAQAESDGTLLTTLCMGTRILRDATEDLAYLRSLHVTSSSFPVAHFSDVPSDDEYAQAIHDFREEGIVQGYSDGSFRPDRPISRAETSQIL